MTVIRYFLCLAISYATVIFVGAQPLELKYKIVYPRPFATPSVTLEISGITQEAIDFIISPMTSFNMRTRRDAYTWLVKDIHAFTTGGQELKVSGPTYSMARFTLVPIRPRYRRYTIYTRNNNRIIIRYDIAVPIVVGYLETLLLRPAHHEQIKFVELTFELPPKWKAVTVVSPKKMDESFVFDLGRLNSMYGDNDDPAYNFVPMAFAVGSDRDIVEVETACGRLIFAYPSMHPTYGGSYLFKQQAELGKRFFEFMCREVGSLYPFCTFIANNNWQDDWMPTYYQPGLYSYFWQHNRTMDWSTGLPSFRFSPWKLGTFKIGRTTIDEPDVTYYHFPHALVRAWFKGTTYFVLSPRQPDWLVRGGVAGYLQEKMLYEAFGPIKVYQRFQQMYEFYKRHYLQTSQDKPLMQGRDHFIEYFKSTLWAFYANQRILEATHGEHDLCDAIRWLYTRFGGSGKAYTYKDVEQAINNVANVDLSELFQIYAYTKKALPLDVYFEDNDGDGIPNGLEIELRLNPDDTDTDDDGILDFEEVEEMFKVEWPVL